MSKHNEIGKKGEEIALEFLEKKGYIILENNWRVHKAEIDIIAKDDSILVFVEVKSRSNTYFGRPETFIDEKKQKMILDAASIYMEEIGHDWEVRFDTISVLFHNHEYQSVEHTMDAFFSGFEDGH